MSFFSKLVDWIAGPPITSFDGEETSIGPQRIPVTSATNRSLNKPLPRPKEDPKFTVGQQVKLKRDTSDSPAIYRITEEPLAEYHYELMDIAWYYKCEWISGGAVSSSYIPTSWGSAFSTYFRVGTQTNPRQDIRLPEVDLVEAEVYDWL